MPTPLSALAHEVAQLRHMVQQLAKGSRYAHGGSIENAALEVKDGAGGLRAILGQQPDGTTGVNVVNGPTPPVPSAPTVEAALAALAVTWDGGFDGTMAAPLDWQRVEVHIGPNPGFTPDQGTLRGTIESPQGGTITVPLPYTEWYVRLRSRTTSGVASAATATVAATPRKADTQDLTAGAVTADTIAVDALTGKTITGGTITGALVQTAASGQRITLNEENANKILVYNSAGTAIGELSNRGLLVAGTNGSVMWLDPNATYPNLRMTNAALTNAAVINVVETTPGAADLGLNSGTFTSSGVTGMKWRHFMGNDFAVIERFRETDPTYSIGGRVDLRATSASIGYRNSIATDDNCILFLHANRSQLNGGRLEVYAPASANTAMYVQADPAHTGNLLRLVRGGNQFTVDKDGNTNVTGMLTAANMAYGRVVITPSAANAPTSATVTYARLTGTDYEGYACASTAVPGMTVTGVSMNNITPTSATVWATRTNMTATGVSWQVIGR